MTVDLWLRKYDKYLVKDKILMAHLARIVHRDTLCGIVGSPLSLFFVILSWMM